MPTFKFDWFSGNIPNWTKFLERFKGKPNLVFLEIGCFEGKATTWLLENILTDPTSKIVTLDTFEGGMDHKDLGVEALGIPTLEARFKENLGSYIAQGQVFLYKGLSQELLRDKVTKQFKEFDFVYVDGSHVACDVLEDAILSFRLLKKDGILIFDDYGWTVYPQLQFNPKMGIDAFLDCFIGQYNLLLKEYQVVIQKT